MLSLRARKSTEGDGTPFNHLFFCLQRAYSCRYGRIRDSEHTLIWPGSQGVRPGYPMVPESPSGESSPADNATSKRTIISPSAKTDREIVRFHVQLDKASVPALIGCGEVYSLSLRRLDLICCMLEVPNPNSEASTDQKRTGPVALLCTRYVLCRGRIFFGIASHSSLTFENRF